MHEAATCYAVNSTGQYSWQYSWQYSTVTVHSAHSLTQQVGNLQTNSLPISCLQQTNELKSVPLHPSSLIDLYNGAYIAAHSSSWVMTIMTRLHSFHPAIHPSISLLTSTIIHSSSVISQYDNYFGIDCWFLNLIWFLPSLTRMRKCGLHMLMTMSMLGVTMVRLSEITHFH